MKTYLKTQRLRDAYKKQIGYEYPSNNDPIDVYVNWLESLLVDKNTMSTTPCDLDLDSKLKEIGFNHIGSGWYENAPNKIRLRLWKDYEIDFWLYRSSIDERWKDIKDSLNGA